MHFVQEKKFLFNKLSVKSAKNGHNLLIINKKIARMDNFINKNEKIKIARPHGFSKKIV